MRARSRIVPRPKNLWANDGMRRSAGDGECRLGHGIRSTQTSSFITIVVRALASTGRHSSCVAIVAWRESVREFWSEGLRSDRAQVRRSPVRAQSEVLELRFTPCSMSTDGESLWPVRSAFGNFGKITAQRRAKAQRRTRPRTAAAGGRMKVAISTGAPWADHSETTPVFWHGKRW